MRHAKTAYDEFFHQSSFRLSNAIFIRLSCVQLLVNSVISEQDKSKRIRNSSRRNWLHSGQQKTLHLKNTGWKQKSSEFFHQSSFHLS